MRLETGARRPALVFAAASVPPRRGVFDFELAVGGRTYPAIALRAGGAVRGYLNRCPHFRVRLDRRTGRYFDPRRAHLLCDTHGALFRPRDGLCVSGPCVGDRLEALEVVELFGECQVFVPPGLEAELLGEQAAFSPR